MKTKLLRNILIFCILICVSCVEEYKLDIDKYENILVVDGIITNEAGPYTVKLSLSSPLKNLDYIPYTNAEVIIIDDLGNSETLIEINPGEYSTAINGMQSAIGRKYKIEINTPENKTYFSNFEELLAPVELDTIYSEIESRESFFHYYDLVGLQFFLDTETAIKDTNYFLWRLESTFEYNSSYRISHIYNGTLEPCANRDTLYTCWKTDVIGEIFTSNTINLSQPKIFRYPLNFVSTEERDLSVMYSLLVKQFTVSENEYNFWHSIDDLNSDQGVLHSSLPYQIRGNILCEQNIDEPVLGYFMVAGLFEKRIFVERPRLTFHYWICYLTKVDFENMNYLRWAPANVWPLYVTTSVNGAMALPHQDCIDCTRKGGVLVKPEFWID